jgi:tRNA(His) guanylyltransferase
MQKDSIGLRMKENYEDRYRFSLTRRTPVIMRLDGRAFHTFTRGCVRPFDLRLSHAMCDTACHLLSEIQGAKCAYVQSDEISILITDFDKLTTDAWFDYNIQKMVSISAGMASAFFGRVIATKLSVNSFSAVFDSRVFNIPTEEVCNYFIWRQLDWMRNSLQMLSQSHFSAKMLHGKNQANMHEMLHSEGVNWADLEPRWKNGVFICNGGERGWLLDYGVIFKENRNSIEKFLIPGEE